jgi:hypothetical protein
VEEKFRSELILDVTIESFWLNIYMTAAEPADGCHKYFKYICISVRVEARISFKNKDSAADNMRMRLKILLYDTLLMRKGGGPALYRGYCK